MNTDIQGVRPGEVEFIMLVGKLGDGETIRKITGSYRYSLISRMKIGDTEVVASDGVKFLLPPNWDGKQLGTIRSDLQVVWLTTPKKLRQYLDDLIEDRI